MSKLSAVASPPQLACTLMKNPLTNYLIAFMQASDLKLTFRSKYFAISYADQYVIIVNDYQLLKADRCGLN